MIASNLLNDLYNSKANCRGPDWLNEANKRTAFAKLQVYQWP